jgi:hypothetical protein
MPLDGVQHAGYRGSEEVRRHRSVIINGEMVAECRKFFGSAALMAVNEIHATIEKPH